MDRQGRSGAHAEVRPWHQSDPLSVRRRVYVLAEYHRDDGEVFGASDRQPDSKVGLSRLSGYADVHRSAAARSATGVHKVPYRIATRAPYLMLRDRGLRSTELPGKDRKRIKHRGLGQHLGGAPHCYLSQKCGIADPIELHVGQIAKVRSA